MIEHDRSFHILLIEDNEIDVEGVRRAFDRHAVENPLVVASDGQRGLEYIKSGRVPKPFVVLLDLNLPRMNGLELLRELDAEGLLDDLTVFVLTTSARDHEREACLRLGVAGYMVKSELGAGFTQLMYVLGPYLSRPAPSAGTSGDN